MKLIDENLNTEFLNLCDDKYFDKLQRFIEKHQDNIDINDGFNWACAYGHLKVAQYLVDEHFADVHTQNDYSIRWAIIRGFDHIINYLLNDKSFMEQPTIETIFWTTCKYGKKEVLDKLIVESNKEKRELITKIIDDHPQSNFPYVDYAKELIDKCNLVDSLDAELLNKNNKNKKNKV